MGITPKELMEDKVQRRIDAYFPPKAPRLAIRVFNFFTETQNYAVLAGGMQHYVIRLDINAIGEAGRRYYNLDLQRYMHFFRVFESKLLEKQDRERKERERK